MQLRKIKYTSKVPSFFFFKIFIILIIYRIILFNVITINMSIYYINSEIKELLMSSQKIKNK